MFVGGSSTEILATGGMASYAGFNWTWGGTAAGDGIRYFAFRLHNGAGWSLIETG